MQRNVFGRLFVYEWKKLLGRRLVQVAAIGMLLLSALVVMGPFLDDVCSGPDAYGVTWEQDAKWRKELDGRVIDQKLLNEMAEAYGMVPWNDGKYSRTEEYQQYARPYSGIFNTVRSFLGMTTKTMFSWEPEEQQFYEFWKRNLEYTWENSYLTEEEIVFYRNLQADVAIPFTYEYISDGWWELQEGLNTFGIIWTLVIALCLSGIFPEEHIRKTDQLILASRNGRKKQYCAKTLAGLVFAAVLSLLSGALALGLAVGLYGIDGMDASFLFVFSNYIYPLTIGRAVIIGILVITAANIIVGAVTMLLSEVFRTGMSAFAVITAVILAGMFINVPPVYRLWSQLWDSIPGRFTMIYNMFSINTVPVFGRCFMQWQVVPVVYLLLAAVIAFAGKHVYLKYEVSGR